MGRQSVNVHDKSRCFVVLGITLLDLHSGVTIVTEVQ
jgi:hypothetical protein